MDILQKPDAFCFSSALKDIIIQSDENIDVSFSLRGQDPFLAETYTPDAENKIYIRDLGKLLTPYISKITLRETFVIQAGNNSITTTVLYGLTDTGIPPEEFLDNHFLTLLRNEKITFPQQKEFLSFSAAQPTTVTAIARYRDGSAITKTLQADSTNQTVTIDVSPSIFSDPEQVIYYAIQAGNRDFTFYLKPNMPREYVQILFLNSFGVKETFIPAFIRRENKYENRFGTFAGKYRKYDVELIKEHTANTGMLNENTAGWIEELFISRDVFLLPPEGKEKEIVIEEAKVERSAAAGELPAFEFKYRPADSSRNEYPPAENRIFDNTYELPFK